jgi:hypothetical protein
MFTSAPGVVCATVLSPANAEREGFEEIFSAHRTAMGKLSSPKRRRRGERSARVSFMSASKMARMTRAGADDAGGAGIEESRT